MIVPPHVDMSRAAREKTAYDRHYGFQERNDRLHRILSHARATPATARLLSKKRQLVLEHARGGAALEIGCGNGEQCKYIFENGADIVHGLDVSERMLKSAKTSESSDGRLRFFLHDIHQPWRGQYNVIFGTAVLHHINYRDVLARLMNENLLPGGIMIFLEPLGGNILVRAYWAMGSLFHTDDERPFCKKDVVWLRHNFKFFDMYVADYLAIPLSALSSFCFDSSSNWLLKGCDNLDTWIASRVPALQTRYRTALFVFGPHNTEPESFA